MTNFFKFLYNTYHKALCVIFKKTHITTDKDKCGKFEKTKKWIIMSFLKSKRLIERQNGIDVLKTINKNKKDVYLIHYSCESFLNTSGRTPRIVSISILNYDNSQTHTYSIHLEAQFKKYDFNVLTETQLDECEKSMLNNYYSFIKKIQLNILFTG